MARKTRKTPAAPIPAEEITYAGIAEGNKSPEAEEAKVNEASISARVWRTALYGRLSMLNNGKDIEDESSKWNQINLIRMFIQKHSDLLLTEEYFDNGYTGTEFDRPEFERMMEDVRNGRINCIVVKDLSRFGRNYLELGEYIDKILPFMGVRFIAITDDFDSLNANASDGLIVPLKNMINEMYSRDISRKIRSAIQTREKAGTRKLTNIPYGYRYAEDGSIVIDEEVSGYVRMIFAWILQDEPWREIARRLNDLGAPTMEVQKIKNGNRITKKKSENDGAGNNEKLGLWRGTSIRYMAQNPFYLGHTVFGKTRSVEIASDHYEKIDPEKWVIYQNTHEAYITQEEFDRIQEICKIRSDKQHAAQANQRKYADEPLHGLVFCGKCKAAMKYKRNVQKSAFYGANYFCMNGADYGIHDRIQINAHMLQLVVEDQLRIQFAIAVDQEELYRQLKDTEPELQRIRMQGEEIEKLQTGLKRTNTKRMRLYENYTNGILDREEYLYTKGVYDREYDKQKYRLDQLLQEQSRTGKLLDASVNPWLKAVEELKNTGEFSRDVITGLIERIEVSEDNHIEITFRYSDWLKDYADYIQGIGNADE